MRLRILASAVPLLIAAVFARGDLLPGTRPCIAIGEGSVQIASLPWQAQSRVSFTRDPALATVRVQLTDNAAAADFAVLDDVDGAEANGCEVNAATRFVAISPAPRQPSPSSICRRTARPTTGFLSVRSGFRRAMPPPSSSAPMAHRAGWPLPRSEITLNVS